LYAAEISNTKMGEGGREGGREREDTKQFVLV